MASTVKPTSQQEDETEDSPWIESSWLQKQHDKDDTQDEDEEDPDTADLFADPDPMDTFQFQYELPNDNKSVEIVLEGYKAELGQTLDSTGLTLWRASELMCHYLLTPNGHSLIRNCAVLELGAGLGLCSILASHLEASQVIVTDGDTHTLKHLRANVARNCTDAVTAEEKTCHNITCRQLAWGEQLDEFANDFSTFDTILGADIIYTEYVLVPLWETVSRLLKQKGVFVLAYARRNVKIDLVLEHAERYGFDWEPPTHDEGVFLFRRRAVSTGR